MHFSTVISDNSDDSTTAPVAPTGTVNSENFILDHNHPLYMHPSDGPASLSIGLLLIGMENYTVWNRAIKVAILGKNKLCLIIQLLNKSSIGESSGIVAVMAGGDTIKNILCVHAFKFNLLSVFKDLLSGRVKEIDNLDMRAFYDHNNVDHEDSIPSVSAPAAESGHSESLPIPASATAPKLPAPLVDDVRKSSRISRPPIWLSDYVRSDKAIQTNSCRYPIGVVIGYDHLFPKYQSYLSRISSEQEPNSYYEAAKDKRWIEAMEAKIKALEDSKTWEIVLLPPGKKAIGCKWVCNIKHKAIGEVEMLKARFVAKRYNQKEGLDYHETFSPIVKMVTIRSVIALATAKHWIIYQMDVYNAFLQSDFD
uniref:Reverse transcriptase Ty1/copia-type domain-containing protein n=1 Tax=Nicotiana tabacum TaxID=4097 RepID=A0A1S4BZ78_TOBAC|nr:PREDICTED: uncharacterized protein LOC107813444 [Nicotiana tabacum]